MEEFSLFVSNRCDIPAVLSESLRNMGSLAASRQDWASLLQALGVNLWFEYHKEAPRRSLMEAAEAIVTSAVPEEGFPHPERAVALYNQEQGLIAFKTPGGVQVSIAKQAEGQDVQLTVAFGRDSNHLATLVLADLFRRVPAAISLLAQVAQEAAEKYEASV